MADSRPGTPEVELGGAPWRILFMGTPEFACVILEALLARPDPVVGVVTQPDKEAGRGRKLTAPPAKILAGSRGIPVLQPRRLRDPSVLQALEALRPDLIVVAAYGKILPASVLSLPAHGALNVHASLLPHLRGAAPVQHAILRGDTTTGVTIMVMNEEMDAGDIVLQEALPIEPRDTAATLSTKLARLGARLIGEAIDGLRAGTIAPRPQPSGGITFAPRIRKEDGRIDWQRPAVEIERAVRAFDPWPGAWTTLRGVPLHVWSARVVERAERSDPLGPRHEVAPGTVVAAGPGGIEVATARGHLILEEVQLAGRRRLAAAEFLRGQPLHPGARLGQ